MLICNSAGRYTSIEQVIGQIYPMCKDQHGCRFLQKKLDEENSQVVDTIFNEVYPHFGELMTGRRTSPLPSVRDFASDRLSFFLDPFGNYLCQKLLEHCNEKQRIQLIESVAGDLVRISQNMHGTRAVQKMIECLRNAQEVRIIYFKTLSSCVFSFSVLSILDQDGYSWASHERRSADQGSQRQPCGTTLSEPFVIGRQSVHIRRSGWPLRRGRNASPRMLCVTEMHRSCF